jgi:multiple antibiotic resistance protein
MLDFTEYTKIFISLFAIIDPVGNIPIIIAFTAGMAADRRARVGGIASLAVLVILLAALLLGELILEFFGISIHSFRTAGGILLLLMGIEMLNTKKQLPEVGEDSESTATIAIVPLSTPLLAGPGAISAVILDAHKGSGIAHYGVMACIILVLCIFVWLTFRVAPFIAQRLGHMGTNIVSRLMGLLVAAIAVEFIAGGLRGLFPALG